MVADVTLIVMEIHTITAHAKNQHVHKSNTYCARNEFLNIFVDNTHTDIAYTINVTRKKQNYNFNIKLIEIKRYCFCRFDYRNNYLFLYLLAIIEMIKK